LDTVTRAELSIDVLDDVDVLVLLVTEPELPVPVVELPESATAHAVDNMSNSRIKLKIPTRLFMKSPLFQELVMQTYSGGVKVQW
jgi:hypothetical protein